MWNTWSTVSISRLASDLLGRGDFVGFPELPDAGEITALVFLQYKISEQVFPIKVPPGSLESVQILESASGARIPLFWEFGSSLNDVLHRCRLFFGRRVQTPDPGFFF
jgi:hypothetical protein